MKQLLTRFWFQFSPLPCNRLNLGCGVTAYSYDDALSLLRRRVFKGEIPAIVSVTENVDISTLDQGHVIPNIGKCVDRGIWYPRGYNDENSGGE